MIELKPTLGGYPPAVRDAAVCVLRTAGEVEQAAAALREARRASDGARRNLVDALGGRDAVLLICGHVIEVVFDAVPAVNVAPLTDARDLHPREWRCTRCNALHLSHAGREPPAACTTPACRGGAWTAPDGAAS